MSTPLEIGGAHVIRYSPVHSLAICQYAGKSDYYLFHCDGAGNVVADTWHATLEEAITQAEFEHPHIGSTWSA